MMVFICRTKIQGISKLEKGEKGQNDKKNPKEWQEKKKLQNIRHTENVKTEIWLVILNTYKINQPSKSQTKIKTDWAH